MANPKTLAPVVDNVAELELANASLAERVGELETELAQRDETIARLTATAEQRERDVEGARFRVREVESKLVTVEAQRDDAQRDREDLHDELRRRSSGAPLALDIAALLDLHRILGGERYLATARRLGDALVAQHEPDASDPG